MRKYITNIMIYVMSVVILGLAQLLEAKFDSSKITSDAFLFDVIIPSIINLMILFNTIFMYKRILLENNLEIKGKQTEIDDTLRTSVGSDLGTFLYSVKNKSKKINAYKRRIQLKLDRLDNGFLHLFGKPSTDDYLLWNSNNDEVKKNNKYCIKKQKLMDLLNDNYIQSNIMHLNVKYRPIKESEIRNGYRSNTVDDDDFEDIDRAVLKEILPGYLQGFLFMTFFSSFILNPKAISLVMVLTFCVKIMTGIWNFFNGKMYVGNSMIKKILNNLDKIINILKDYCIWKINQKKAGEAK